MISNLDNIIVWTGKYTRQAISEKLDKASVVNNLTTSSSGYALDARQGKALNDNKANKDGSNLATPDSSDNSTKIATTAFVQSLLSTVRNEISNNANIASTKASEASTSATNASSSASSASASASSASASEENARRYYLDAQATAEGVASLTTVGVDTSLIISGSASDSKVVGDRIRALESKVVFSTSNEIDAIINS